MHLVLAVRRLRRRWLATALLGVAVSLAAGAVGASVAFLDALAWRPLAVANPEQLVTIAPKRGEALLGIPEPTLDALATSTPLVSTLCGYSRGAALIAIGGRESRRSLEALSARCASVLGVRPAIGRWLAPEDEPPGGSAAPVVVISDAFWRATFGADPAVVGRTLRVETHDLRIIGVLPPAFRGIHVDQGADVIVPRGLLGPLLGLPASVPALYAIGRLAPNATLDAVDAEVRARWPALWARTAPPAPPGAPPAPAAQASALEIQSGRQGLSDLRRQYGQAAVVLLGLSAVLLALAAVSVASVFAATVAARHTEIAVLASLGATPRQAAGQVLAGAACLGVISGLGACGVAVALARVVAATIWTATVPMTLTVSPSAVLLAGLLVATAALVLTLAVPAARTAWGLASAGLTSSGWRVVGGPPEQPFALGAQTACAVALVFAAMAFGHNVQGLYQLNLGYAVDGLRWSTLDRVPGAPSGDDPVAYTRATLDRVRAVPGVAGAAFSASFPLMQLRTLSALTALSRPGVSGETRVAHARVSSGFFDTLGIAFLEGQAFRDEASGPAPAGAVLNQPAARRLFGDASPLGQALHVAGHLHEVVGVVPAFSPGDVRLDQVPAVFTAVTREPALLRTPILVVRATPGTPPDPDAVSRAVREGGRHVSAPPRDVWGYLTGLLARERMIFGLAGLLGVTAVIVAGAGLFSTLALVAAHRRREMAVRLALGASPAHAARAVFRRVTIGVVAGGLAGLPLAWALARVGRALFYRTSPYEPRVLAVSAAILAVVALGAALAPCLSVWRMAPARHLNEPG